MIPSGKRRKRRTYIPDILVEYKDGNIYLEEVKGVVFDATKFGAKNLAALGWCARNNVTFRLVFEKGLETVA